ncbi:DNA polymerase IV [Methanoregula sp.]|uniref:DNA polymerase IV n=1 Tax=Methanoregula sp. TaxID=2052170 RepID=UPI00236D431A|nr:DNA polymerase IV [Methanoregula sp.]MDD1686658.1 DNA polymerase IV [Methanoregula sp.]
MVPVTVNPPAITAYPDALHGVEREIAAENRRIIIHLDMDSFYASVEVQRRPDLAGKPVVIGADPKQGKGRGVVSTCSYEARAFGIRSAMPISQAFVLCPHAIFLPPDFPAYTQASVAVMGILRSYGFLMEQVSIDEAFLDVSPVGNFPDAQARAEEIRAAIRNRLGLSCSIGIAPSMAVAKIASDFKKPNGLTVVPPAALQAFLDPLPVRKIPGVGKKAEALLLEMGIRTVGDLLGHDVQDLIGRFGRSAIALHQLACGNDDREIVDSHDVKSISRETTFDMDTDDPEVIISTLDLLASSVCDTLAEEQLRFKTLTLKIRYPGFITRNKSRSLSHYSRDPATVRSLVRILFREVYDGRKIRLIGIRLSSFEKTDALQATLCL